MEETDVQYQGFKACFSSQQSNWFLGVASHENNGLKTSLLVLKIIYTLF